jgi:hypothetical protein
MKCGNRSSINDDKCVLVNEGVILLLIGIMPNKAIGEGRSKGTDKRGRAGLSKPGGRNMTARAKEDGRGARRRYGVPAGEQGLLMESLAPRVREVNKAMFMNNLPSSITADKEPIKVRVKIQLTTNIETINFQHNLGTNRHPRGKGGGKGVTKGVILGKMGKIRIESLIRGDEVSKGSRNGPTIQQVNKIEIMLGGWEQSGQYPH